MLSWALKRNAESARDAPGPDDTTQLEGPDTPAPVFAVRALKTALFGTPAPRTYDRPEQTRDKAPSASPVKPPGILLTPGTATSRRKRVSFGHGVKEGAAVQPIQPSVTTTITGGSGVPDNCPGKFPSPWTKGKEEAGQTRPKTRLTAALENSRTNKSKQTGVDVKPVPKQIMEEAWEEIDGDEDDEEESDRDPDVTYDLNEPHSRSGKYWKSYFESYHADAKAEMEKLVKYKQLAKSYAKKKDAEALDLNEKLKEEQERVNAMESKVAELSRQVALTRKRGGSESETGLMVDELTRQTALASDYRKQVNELESLLRAGETADLEDNGPKQRRIASPRTQKTLIETQKELRRARSQSRELEKIREERDRLRSELKFAEQRTTKLAEENKKISMELSQGGTKIQDLEKRLVESRGEALLKDRELKKLRTEYEKLKEDAKARHAEALQVLESKNKTISDLQDEIASLREEGAKWTEQRRVVLAEGSVAGRTKPRVRSSTTTDRYKRNSYEDEALVSSRALREKIETEMGKRTSTVLSDRANLQDSRSSASSGVSQVSAYTRPTSSLATGRAERTSAASTRPSTARSLHDDMLSENYPSRAYTKHPDQQQHSRRPMTARSQTPDTETPKVDLVEDTFARLGGPETHTSTVWTAMDASRTTTMTADRRAAAVRRLAAKRAKREREQRQQDQERLVDRNKENMMP